MISASPCGVFHRSAIDAFLETHELKDKEEDKDGGKK